MTTTANAPTEMQVIADIVAAFAKRPDVSGDQIASLYSELRNKSATPVSASTPAPTPAASPEAAPALSTDHSVTERSEIPASTPKATPAVPIADSVSKNSVTCLCCGKSFTMLKRHLGSEHGLTVPEYFRMFDLPEGHPIVAPNYSKVKASQAKRSEFGKYDRTGKTATKSKAKADS